MDHPEKATRKRKPKPNAQTTAPSTLPISPSLAAQPTVAPGAIPEGGTGTELEALRRTQEEKEPVQIAQDGVASKALAARLGAAALESDPVYDASLSNGTEVKVRDTPEGLTLVDPLNDVSHKFDTTTQAITEIPRASQPDEDTGTLAKIVDKFNGVELTDVPIPRAAALGDHVSPVRAARRQRQDLSHAESYALEQAKVVAADQAVVDEQDAKSQAVQFAEPIRTTRLKMTLHAVSPLENPALTRCTFGAVYSANPTDEDKIFGDATPYGSLSYNVRSEVAEGLEVGAAYYVDITKVPS